MKYRDAIRKRLREATPEPIKGEWFTLDGKPTKRFRLHFPRNGTDSSEMLEADVDFFIAARTDLETLSSLVEKAEAELRNIGTRGNNCECAAHGWANKAWKEISAILDAEAE